MYDKSGADELVFLDITASSDGRNTTVDLVRKVAERVFIPFTVGGGIRSIDDSKEGVERFLRRNPTTSFVAVKEGKIVGSILCGHDGRQGSLYHVCVDEAYRRHGIGKDMVVHSMKALQEEKINKVCLIAFAQNNVGNAFWNTIGWTERLDVNYYDFILNEENITAFNEQ